jgi:hypothetical protein
MVSNSEVVDTTLQIIQREFRILCQKTEIDHSKDADEMDEIDLSKEDWRFHEFFMYAYVMGDNTLERAFDYGEELISYSAWQRDPIPRQFFIHWLRGDIFTSFPPRFGIVTPRLNIPFSIRLDQFDRLFTHLKY